MEDNEYVSGLGDMDKHNGRWCVTPECPNGTYAYFVRLNELYGGAFPYIIAGSYYGTAPYTNDQNTATASITASVTIYSPPPASPLAARCWPAARSAT